MRAADVLLLLLLLAGPARAQSVPGVSAPGVSSITGTANQITTSGSTGAVTLSTPQSLNTSSSPTFANATVTTALTVGGASITPPLTGTTGALGGGLLLAGVCATGTVSIANAATSMLAVASPTTYPGDGTVWFARVTSAGTVTVYVCAIVSLTPTSTTYLVRVVQ